MHITWTEEDVTALKLHYKKVPMSELEIVLKKTPSAIYQKAKKLGLAEARKKKEDESAIQSKDLKVPV